jgi:hypothetical protein
VGGIPAGLKFHLFLSKKLKAVVPHTSHTTSREVTENNERVTNLILCFIPAQYIFCVSDVNITFTDVVQTDSIQCLLQPYRQLWTLVNPQQTTVLFVISFL